MIPVYPDWSRIDRATFDGPAHYSCDGTVSEVLATVPGNFLRVGDTATAEERPGSPIILRCARIEPARGASWEVLGAHSKALAQKCIAAAGCVIVVHARKERARSS